MRAVTEIQNIPMFIYFFFSSQNTTALIQPLDMGIIKSFKSLYFNKLIDFTLIFEKEQLSDLNLNNVNLRQVITVVGEAWKMMSETTIINCWQKINENRSKISDNVQLDEELIDDVISDVISMDSTDIIEDKITYDGYESKKSSIKEIINIVNSLEDNIFSTCPQFLKIYYEFIKNLSGELKKNQFGEKITDYF
ncbi:tigger transposable element-derived protein 6-like [Octopus sinensis]|uniref:Tigger transposable element-derived protein 6-like n=1 Tax=Octopus sinensis TaxID=2607531 RepID=A0A6P7TRY3_9MOLL|nr:tigger transposable element-derived protein 6-like [Octopus sinensis]